MPMPYKVVILGGYGNFGARIARRLSCDAHIQVIIAGRDLEKARSFAQQLNNATAVALDVSDIQFATALRGLKADVLIHTAGPFQQQNYRVAQIAAEVGMHYIDLADGRQFVCDFSSALNDSFLKAGKLAVSGASTVPALSSAVVDALRADMQQIDTIDICIAPAQQAPRGVATLQAVLGYCGEPISVWQNSRWVEEIGWSDMQRIAFARMKPRLGALCDIPDLSLFVDHYKGVKSVMFRAALEIEFTQRIFALLAFLRKRRLLPNLARLAPLLHHTAHWFDQFGSALGGMVVKVSGISKEQKTTTREWHITADDNHGPEIPCMAAILLARKLARGELQRTGAFPCLSLLTLQEFEPEFRFWNMQSNRLYP